MGERVSFKPPVSTLKLGREAVDISTNYKDDFTFKETAKPKSYAPMPTFIQPGVKMDSSTEAHDQFTGTYYKFCLLRLRSNGIWLSLCSGLASPFHYLPILTYEIVESNSADFNKDNYHPLLVF